ncbi:BZ3500_MvSof-1268-A1-R1_Chr9g10719 [Microbotryum saponariae]|uniref:BZ3500_MvSof-1268-A1-R1_Chr9g10719 protein n=1 Tax=Microbotryum saponariae TaxID=289078 RepID=A0A2X0L6P7_9BASI|nr:BZ3501_MvSof-1269-A2-R1_Chr9g10467 [Microbotryum saponariae]SDA00580.1 BZ3500_MvSof-1268-A1-R1_Chr9g10719 [Microbotryum saponariae]
MFDDTEMPPPTPTIQSASVSTHTASAPVPIAASSSPSLSHSSHRPHGLAPGDHLNFSFSPSSPPQLTSFLAGSTSHFGLVDDMNTSTVSPSLFSADASTSTATIAQSIAHNLGPPSPPRGDSPGPIAMDEDSASTTLGSTLSNQPLSSSAQSQHSSAQLAHHSTVPAVGSAVNRSSSTSHSRTSMVNHEDALRRGPPAADTPGGDCKSLCLRHQRMANGGTNLMLQKSIENLPPHDQNAVNTIWSLFSSSPSKRRLLILRGLLTIACPSQLSFLQDALTLEMRLDPIELLPREVSLKVFSYLDAISLGRAAQVSKTWKHLADDDLLWRNMCEQHIERKCEKCGWGLPLLGERRRKARTMINALPAHLVQERGETRRTAAANPDSPSDSEVDASIIAAHAQTHHNGPEELSTPSTSTSEMVIDVVDSHRAKRAKTQSPGPSRAASPRPTPTSPRSGAKAPQRPGALSASLTSVSAPVVPSTRPWKLVYCERLAIERNWRRGQFVSTVLSGHTDAITCLQVAEDLPHPSFPVLMTGSWDRSVRIWNLETGSQVGVLRGHLRGVRALQFDALKLVTGSMDETLKIWNWRTGECMRTLRGHRGAVICLTYDKQLLVSGSGDTTIRVWDFGTGEVQTLRGHTEWVNSVALYDSNAECGTGGSATPSADGELGGGPTTNPEAARASSKGKYLISGSDDMTIRVWDLYTRQCVRVLTGHVAQVQSIKITVSDEQRTPGFPASSLNPKNKHRNSDNKVEARGRMMLNGPSVSAQRDDAGSSFTSSTASTSSCSSNRETNGPALMNAATWQQQQQQPSQRNHRVAGLSPNPQVKLDPLELANDKKPLIVSASLDNTIKVWDVESGLCQRTMFGHIEGVWDVDVDKLRIVSGSHDRTLKIWDRDTGKSLHTLVGHTSAVTAVVLQDQYVITGGDDSQVRIWNFARSKAE